MFKRTITAITLAAALAACGGQTESQSAPASASGQSDAAGPSGTAPKEGGESESPASAADRGRALFAACGVCHSIREGDNARIGPSLFGVYGRAAGAVEDFAYSDAMKESAVTWDDDALNAYLENPQEFMPGNRMAYPGENNADNRAAVIEYLKTLGSAQE